MASNPVKQGDTFGVMRCMSPVLADQTIIGAFMCMACYAMRSVTTDTLKQEVVRKGGGGCLECDAMTFRVRRAHGVAPPKPTRTNFATHLCREVKTGERFGLMEATVDCPRSTIETSFRCVQCQAERMISASQLKMAIRKGMNSCTECKEKGDKLGGKRVRKRQRNRSILNGIVSYRCKRCWAKLTAPLCLKLYHWRDKSKPQMRCVRDRSKKPPEPAVIKKPKMVRYRVLGVNCVHKKELICVDPGGVKILRCRVCDEVGVPAVECQVMVRPAGRWGGNLTHRMWEETDVSWDNAVRLIEDAD